MSEISVVIPVYKAEKHLRKCVESLVYGEEQDLEIILVEDCSPDNSWELCRQLAEEYAQVKCFRNERNSGVSHTRNRGMDEATGKFLLFVDSDDWVSSSYAKTMIETQRAHPDKLVACGYTFVDYVANQRQERGLLNVGILDRRDFAKLAGGVMLQQLWNKVFCLSQIRKAGIRFDESICMGEDFQFVMDVIEAADLQQCVVINQPLYYYIRWNSTSLMGNWAEHESYEQSLERRLRLDRICGITETSLYDFNYAYVYRIVRESNLPKSKKREIVQDILGEKESKAFLRTQNLLAVKEKLMTALRSLSRFQK